MRQTTAAIVVLCGLLSGRPARAQALYGGLANEVSTGRPARCLCVALIDSTGRTVDSTWTRAGGRFQFFVTPPGKYRLRFSMPGIVDVITDWDQLDGASEVARVYRVPMQLDARVLSELRLGRAEYTTTLRPRGGIPTPNYPIELLGTIREGTVIVGFPIDTSGQLDTAAVIPFQSTHPAFLASVWRTLPRIRFLPWRSDSGADCALALQPYIFRSEF